MERLKRLADEAERYAKLVDLKISPTLHITKALQGIPEGRERDLLFGEIRKELNRREREKREDQKNLKEALEQKKKADAQAFLRGAWAHQKQQPPKTWDPHAEDDELE